LEPENEVAICQSGPALPVNVLIVIPGLILWLSNGSAFAAESISISDTRMGLVALFARHGDDCRRYKANVPRWIPWLRVTDPRSVFHGSWVCCAVSK
jgi:hypothetical protein